MPVRVDAAARHASYQEDVALRAMLAARSLWARAASHGHGMDGWWSAFGSTLVATVSAAQVAAARDADPYMDAVLAETGQVAPPEGLVVPEVVAASAADGRALAGLLYQPVFEVKSLLAGGMKSAEALARGGRSLDLYATATVQDTGRHAVSAAMGARPRVGGYVRQIVPPSCSRCVVLAGKWFRWNQGFKRHDRCDCRHIAAAENMAGDLTTDPEAYFASLPTAAELSAAHPDLTVKMRREAGLVSQEDAFTKAGAESIRLGADIRQVVNARRGALGLTPAGARLTASEAKALRNGLDRGRLQSVELFGRKVNITTEGTTVRGAFGRATGDAVKTPGVRYKRSQTARIMPETILEISENRADAIRLLKRYGFITG